MPEHTLPYKVSNFTAGVNVPRLKKEISIASISQGLIEIKDFTTRIDLVFEDDLDNVSENALYTVLDSHDGTPDADQSINNLSGTTAPTVNDDIDAGYSVGSTWINQTTDREYTCVDSTAAAAVWKQTTSKLFEYSESEGETSNSTTSYVQKLRHTTAALLAGDFLIEYCAECGTPEGSQNVRTKVEVDDTTIICEWDADANGTFWNGFSGFKKITLTAGAHDIDMDFKSSSATQVNIRRARIRIREL